MIGQPKIVTCTRIPIQRANKEESDPKPSIPPPQSNHSPYSSQLSPPNLLYSEEFSLITDHISSSHRPRWKRYDETRLQWLLSKENDMSISFNRKVLLFSLPLFPQNRIKLFDWLIDVSTEFDISTETTLLAFSLIDAFTQTTTLSTSHLQCLGSAALRLASKFTYSPCPSCKG
ncbi:uncharacterized protein [Blastocystis hominis]|uniref:Cyclin N-terminal domain-containing protein n=1 Tax=Blastocystis hominis TaxID=12968 RepID=D8M3E0_BLAHO|nr:uncharacterized protein [Blastocystis hominis]CBK22413.2 unnamed protein product [Blastocystis hominis]|eukprot:XP_012896461.1 uncharacterized protein [Blastocystis hominis]